MIGIGLDREVVTSALDTCLLTEAEMALGWWAWRRFDAPFMVWVET